MNTVEKERGKNFKILVLPDIQLNKTDWEIQTDVYKLAVHTVETLICRVAPDMIVLLGDMSYGDQGGEAYERLAEYIDGFRIPWSLVWVNHDNQGGEEFIRSLSQA